VYKEYFGDGKIKGAKGWEAAWIMDGKSLKLVTAVLSSIRWDMVLFILTLYKILLKSCLLPYITGLPAAMTSTVLYVTRCASSDYTLGTLKVLK
jgi:hypothetical protein